MIDLRRGFERIGNVLLVFWIVGWVALFVWGTVFAHPDLSQWPLFLATFIAPPLIVFWLWRLLLWILNGFIRAK